MLILASCEGPDTEGSGAVGKGRQALSAAPGQVPGRRFGRRELRPEPVQTDQELKQKGLDIREATFRKSWSEGRPDYVVEGTVTSAQAELIPNNTSALAKRPWFIVTRYQVAVTTRWGTPTQPEGEFWVLGGKMPPGTPVPPSKDYPLGTSYSFESYPEIGDHVLVAIKMMLLPSGGAVPRPVYNADGVMTVCSGSDCSSGGANVARTTNTPALPPSNLSRVREQLNAHFAK